MKIGIDTFGCDPKSGLGSYLINFITNLPQESNIEFELFGLEKDRYTFLLEKDFSFISVNIADKEKALENWHKHKFNKFVRKNNYDVVLFPAAEYFLPAKLKNVTGVAVIKSILTESYKNKKRNKLNSLRKSLQKMQKIVVSTNVIKNDLVKIGICEDNIKVIPDGIDHKLFYPTNELLDEIVDIKPFAIKRPYFVYASSLSSADKKHIELIKAFSIFKKNTGFEHRLVIAGNDGAYSEVVHNAAYNSEFASDIFITGYFPHESFPRLYAGADACVFPSVGEGSGLPVIEAFACGIPVACSDKGALKEISEEAAVYFDSDNVDEIASKMQEIVENKTLREQKVAEGFKKSAEYNWETTVSLTIDYILN